MQTESISESPQLRQWALILHLSQFAGYVVPLAGWIAPLVIWQIKKTEIPGLDAHGKVVANWILSMLIYCSVSGVLMFLLIGFPLLIMFAILGIIFPIIGALKADHGIVWKYPLSLTFFR
jgi:uncharacterized Tic20 family protein